MFKTMCAAVVVMSALALLPATAQLQPRATPPQSPQVCSGTMVGGSMAYWFKRDGNTVLYTPPTIGYGKIPPRTPPYGYIEQHPAIPTPQGGFTFKTNMGATWTLTPVPGGYSVVGKAEGVATSIAGC